MVAHMTSRSQNESSPQHTSPCAPRCRPRTAPPRSVERRSSCMPAPVSMQQMVPAPLPAGELQRACQAPPGADFRPISQFGWSAEILLSYPTTASERRGGAPEPCVVAHLDAAVAPILNGDEVACAAQRVSATAQPQHDSCRKQGSLPGAKMLNSGSDARLPCGGSVSPKVNEFMVSRVVPLSAGSTASA